MFISFEGGEGTGKSTQIRRLAGFLERRGKSVVVLREPGGAPGAEAIRTLLLNGDPDRWDAIEELLLFSAARHELVRTKIKPALEQGSWVLCDRYADSSAVYQGRAGGVPEEILQAVEDLATGQLTPDLTFLLDLPVEVGLARASSRIAGQSDENSEARFEAKDKNFHESVRAAFLSRAVTFSERFCVIDADRDESRVAATIQSELEQRL